MSFFNIQPPLIDDQSPGKFRWMRDPIPPPAPTSQSSCSTKQNGHLKKACKAIDDSVRWENFVQSRPELFAVWYAKCSLFSRNEGQQSNRSWTRSLGLDAGIGCTRLWTSSSGIDKSFRIVFIIFLEELFCYKIFVRTNPLFYTRKHVFITIITPWQPSINQVPHLQ